MNDNDQSKLTARTTQNLLLEAERCFSGTLGLLLLLGMGGAFQISDHVFRTFGTIAGLMFVMYFSLRFFRLLREVKRRDEQDNSNTQSDGIRR